jgi:hypothetical protein
MRVTVLSAVSVVATIGCAPKEKQPEAAAAPVITATMPDSAAKAVADSITADSVKRASATKATKAAAKAGEKPLRDSAFGPKFKVDSNGKVIPIKRP